MSWGRRAISGGRCQPHPPTQTQTPLRRGVTVGALTLPGLPLSSPEAFHAAPLAAEYTAWTLVQSSTHPEAAAGIHILISQSSGEGLQVHGSRDF